MKRAPIHPVFPPRTVIGPFIAVLVMLIALAVCLGALAMLGAAALRLLEIHSIADRLLPAWSWLKLALVAFAGLFIIAPLFERFANWAWK